ncbi:hypothetical protein QC764_0019290 [Podospora pseudoanserina]|uniref:Laccase n=1 Tax=Podospora pseudoanserina TaxID=2609844 RepID=A0ABR0IQJ3_9PEZI|nr:hypothetical protein QC764_0019290 [Podospora pseudoanserina]
MGSFWVLVARLLGVTTLSTYEGLDRSQSPLQLTDSHSHVETSLVSTAAKDPLHFRPPGHRQDKGDGFDFKCDYRKMVGWEKCSTPEDRSCWLVNKKTGERFDINTDYENYYPTGTTREYFITVDKSNITADGYTFYGATVFNETYPGPWIQACWGDTVKVHVRNLNPDRGTSIHWHGIRQLNTMHMDGVNGITQCPIAPGSTFTYEWKVMQYGSSWYHSHYSEQYGDGAVGPITLHGPSSAPYDEAADIPLLMTDWRHGSLFPVGNMLEERWIQSILLNGIGNVTKFGARKVQNTSKIPKPYTLTFTADKVYEDEPPELEVPNSRPKRYLLRLINTSIGSTFIFSIDNHLLSIVSADFVPIYPYLNSSILVGIGQRYNVIVEANPRNNTKQPLDSNENYWIRTWVAPNCGAGVVINKDSKETYMQTGILRYNKSSTEDPESKPWTDISMACSDETATSLRPVLPWVVEDPINVMSTESKIQHMAVISGPPADPIPSFPQASYSFRNVSGGINGPNPLQINFSDPVFLNLDNDEPFKNKLWEIYPEGRPNQTDWVWLAITVDYSPDGDTSAHPIHLHGHDFAILQQAEKTTYVPENIHLNLINPPRRDVVLMPKSGFIIIAFKADNPGAWLLHCHIASHASQGLALQILERQADAAAMWPKASPAAQTAATLCSSWDSWVAASYTSTPTPLPDDSGI